VREADREHPRSGTTSRFDGKQIAVGLVDLQAATMAGLPDIGTPCIDAAEIAASKASGSMRPGILMDRLHV
jgi:hypothetical protein